MGQVQRMSDLASIRGLALRKTALARKGPGLHRSTPPRLEGCRPASRGLTLDLLTYVGL